MINVYVSRDLTSNCITSFEVKGHANYAEHGYDIVCAGVSAVTVGTVNAIEKLAGIELPVKVKSGFVSSSIPRFNETEVSEKVQLLLESMLVMLESIADSYGDYVKLHNTTSNKS